MAIDPGSAADSLSEVARIERKTREAARYSGAAYFLFWWGGLTTVGYLVNQFALGSAFDSWRVIIVLGIAGSAIIRYVRSRNGGTGHGDRRMVIAQVVLLAFGALWVTVFGHFEGRGLGAFWPTLFMLGFVLGGLWIGRVFVAIGVTVTLLTVAGYFWAGPWFGLWMAVVNGGGLIAGGVFLRRIGLAR